MALAATSGYPSFRLNYQGVQGIRYRRLQPSNLCNEAVGRRTRWTPWGWVGQQSSGRRPNPGAYQDSISGCERPMPNLFSPAVMQYKVICTEPARLFWGPLYVIPVTITGLSSCIYSAH